MTLTASPVSAPSRTIMGIVCVVIGMTFFAAQDALMKVYLPFYPIWFLLFLRSCMAVVILVPLILLVGGWRMMATRLMHIHCLRGALFAVGFSAFYMAFPFMGLAEATTIFFSAPLIIALMAVVFLGERIGPHRIGALALGFAGVLIAINPTAGAFTWISILPFISAILYAASQILARFIGERESSLSVGLYTLVWSGPVVLVTGYLTNVAFSFGPEFSHMEWRFPPIPATQFAGLIALGLAGLAGYVLLSRAYQVAEPSRISLFDYSYLPIATAVAWIIWSELPPTNTVIGMALVISSGIYIGIREMRHSADPAYPDTPDPAPISETLIAPGNPMPGGLSDDASGEDLRS